LKKVCYNLKMGESEGDELEDNYIDERPWYEHYDAEPLKPAPAWLDEVEWADPDGIIKVLNPDWLWWQQMERGSGKEEPIKFLERSFSRVADSLQGWKLHLNFDRADEEKVDNVANLLTMMRKRKLVSGFKIGRGEPGKDATVYVGHRDKAVLVASLIERGIGPVLNDPNGDALVDDISFSNHVMGRFEVTSTAHDFYSYGTKGYPVLREDVPGFEHVEGKDREVYLRDTGKDAEIISRAYLTLRDRFGEFFTGKHPA
jgi:hypothetical protein